MYLKHRKPHVKKKKETCVLRSIGKHDLDTKKLLNKSNPLNFFQPQARKVIASNFSKQKHGEA